MGRTLVLFPSKDAYYFGHIQSPKITIDQVFDNRDYSLSSLLKLLRKINSPLTRLFYRDWYKELGDYEKVVVFDSTYYYDKRLMYNIRKKSPRIKGFYYSWNIVTDESRYKKERKEADTQAFSYYCYDHGNCTEYSMKFNTIMYDQELKLHPAPLQYDVLFLGFLKDRQSDILSIYQELSVAGFNPQFVIVKKHEVANNLPFVFRESYVDYYEYLSMLSKSRAILDVAQKNQDGLSMRVMEAIFFDKKLITTNRSILSAPFFLDSNILFYEIGKTSPEDISTFFNKELVPYSQSVKEYYSFERWVDRFLD